MGINEDILRFMTVRVEALEQGPSVMMRKREDEDRGERGRGGRAERPPRRQREEAVESVEVAEQ